MLGSLAAAQDRTIAVGTTASIVLLRTAGLVILLAPITVLIVLSFAQDSYLVLPPTGYSFRWYANIVNEPTFLDGFLVSLLIAVVVTIGALSAGILAAYGQWRFQIVPRRLLDIIFSLPILVPTVVIGMSLVVLFARLGFYHSFWKIVLAHIVLTLPFVIRSVDVALTRYDLALDEAAANLGAGPLHTFWHVTLPQVRSGIFAGGLFAFILSFDDFGLTIFLIDSNTVPLPVAMYHYMEWNLNPTLSAVSAVLIGMSAAVAVLIDRLVGLDRFLGLR